MGTTLEDIAYEEHLQEQWEHERKEVFVALQEIADSSDLKELRRNLNSLKGIYTTELSFDHKKISNLVSKIDFTLPRLEKYITKEFNRSSKITWIQFGLGLVLGFIVSKFT